MFEPKRGPFEVYKVFKFEAAHRLTCVPEDHKCAGLHGHSFEVKVTLAGQLDEAKEWLRDFADISEAWRPLYEQLDHKYLNEVEGLENPTSEVLARWIGTRLRTSLGELYSVEVKETVSVGAVWYNQES